MMRKILCGLLAAGAALPAFALGNNTIGYRTVAAAMADLKAKKNVSIRIQNGWTIIDDKAADAVWSFVPAGHPAYPAVIRRTGVVQGGKAGIATESLCQNNKSACDRLMDEFEVRAKAPAAHGVPVSEIDVQRLGDTTFRLVLTSYSSKSAEAGQRELRPRAQQLCGDRTANFGKYDFNLLESFRDAGKDQGHLVLRQNIRCGEADAVPETSPERAKVPVAASAEQVRRVEEQTRLYFAAKDQRRYQQAYALMSPIQQQAVPFDGWQARAQAFNVKAGAVRERSITRITWYQDPPQAAPGLYAAVDFSSQFEQLAIHCGFVAWSEQKDGSFLLAREEEYSLDQAVASKLKPEEIARARAKLGCRN